MSQRSNILLKTYIVLEEKKETKICISCGREKDLNHFYKNGTFLDGRESRCKLCKQQGITKNPKKYIKKEDNWKPNLRLTGVKDEDYCVMYEFFNDIGYSLGGDIHEQFCLKYGLSLKKRAVKEKNRITYEQCKSFF